jgi:hypothetical protein
MSEFISIWYQPALGALHVLGIAWFGATLFVDAPALRRIGFTWMLVTGALLFAVNMERVYASTSFRLKVALLLAMLFVRRPQWMVLALWVAVVFASRGIAYF